jgi:hypothetical protein
MKTADIKNENGYVVYLYINNDLFGTVDVRNKSIHYAEDVVENWQNGILTEDNQHIKNKKTKLFTS